MWFNGYQILIVPKDATKTRRLRISSSTARFFAFGSLVALPLIIGAFFLVVFYQNQLVSMRRSLAENRQVLEQKDMISSRLANLERNLVKTEGTLGTLEHTMDVELGEMKTGLGPIPEEVLLQGSHPEITPLRSRLDELMENGEDLNVSRIRMTMNDAADRIAGLNKKIEEVYELNSDKIRFVASSPSIMPVNGWITSDFGVRHSPYSGALKMHYGLDIASPIGTPIVAPADGKVVYADFRGGYGRMLMIDHGYGLSTVYGHTSKLFVKVGDLVKKGEMVAAVGSTGSSTGPHLHYEVHVDGIPTDPLNFVVQ